MLRLACYIERACAYCRPQKCKKMTERTSKRCRVWLCGPSAPQLVQRWRGSGMMRGGCLYPTCATMPASVPAEYLILLVHNEACTIHCIGTPSFVRKPRDAAFQSERQASSYVARTASSVLGIAATYMHSTHFLQSVSCADTDAFPQL